MNAPIIPSAYHTGPSMRRSELNPEPTNLNPKPYLCLGELLDVVQQLLDVPPGHELQHDHHLQ